MLRLVALDTGPLGLLTHPRSSPDSLACQEWLAKLSDQRVVTALPEIADYELRREYLLNRNERSLKKLDALVQALDFLPVSTRALREAAQLWANSRQVGLPTSHPKALDGDCILIAQVQIEVERLGLIDGEWIIATSDIGDLPRLAPAARWKEVSRS